MRYLKLFESFNEKDINEICRQYGIKNYTINDDRTVDVNGDVDFDNKKLKKIPLKFGKVSGYFLCYNNQLMSLEGCPQEVGGGFYCYSNQLTSLWGCPKEVGGSFDCSNNQLTSLEGCPKEVRGDFNCKNNKLTSLEGCPQTVGGNFICNRNNIVSFEGPRVIRGDFSCDDNPVWTIWNMISTGNEWDYDLMERFIDYDIIQDGVVILDRLNYFLDEIGKDPVTEVEGYKVL